MKTRRESQGVPEPGSPWDEILPGLWMGGHLWSDASGAHRSAVARDQFELVISLFTSEGHGPDAGVDHHVAEMPDGPLDSGQLNRVARLADLAAEAVRDGRSTLVRCQYGYNRSGLVVAQALVVLGHAPADAVALIRQRRSPWALHNRLFRHYLDAGLDVACLLTDLDPLS